MRFKSAFMIGYEAAKNKEPSCPYPIDSEEYRDWTRGLDEAMWLANLRSEEGIDKFGDKLKDEN